MRTLFFDTDLLLLLSTLEYFDTTLGLFKVERRQVYILDTVQYLIKSPRLKQQHGEQAIARLQLLLPDFKTLTGLSEVERRVLRALAPVEEVDPGEALLIAKTVSTPEAILLSGDKRWMLALCKREINSVRRVKKKLQRKVVSLEHLLLALLEEVGFEKLFRAVTKSNLPHTILRILFRRDVEDPEDHCREGLFSYLGELEAAAGAEFFYQV